MAPPAFRQCQDVQRGPFISSSLTSLLPMERWLFTTQSATAVLQCLNENSHLPLTLHGTASPKASISVLSQGAPGSIPFRPWHAHSVSHRSPTIGSDGIPRLQNQMPSITLSTKMHETSSRVILMDMPLMHAALYGVLLGECVR